MTSREMVDKIINRINTINTGCMVIVIVLLLVGVVPTTFGIVKSFQSFWVTGIIVTLLEPAPFIVGVCEIFGYPLADKITALYHK
ncbi:hypothetical protein LCGC14_2123050 [marine sediment metagenome]|uniref:Uncharacterized protein n=1 Tax=marine sediment metagenome TaxID=412755 RepID=A0A0F9GZX0_9ZZZZ